MKIKLEKFLHPQKFGMCEIYFHLYVVGFCTCRQGAAATSPIILKLPTDVSSLLLAASVPRLTVFLGFVEGHFVATCTCTHTH